MESESVLASYPHVMTLPVLWADMDAFQHVNNTAYLKWFESSRIAFFESTNLREHMQANNLQHILASLTCNYKKQLKYPDTVLLGARVKSLGRTSVVIEHVVFSSQLDAIAAEGSSVVVAFDYSTQRAVRVPQAVRDAIAELQGEVPEHKSNRDRPA